MSDVALGIDVGGTKALALLVRRDGRVLDSLQAPTPHDDSLGAGVATAHVLSDLVRQLSSRNDLDVRSIPVGIGLPGMMQRDGRLAFSPNLQSAAGADTGVYVAKELENATVFSENDADCAALSEHEWGAARGVDDFVMVTLGTGIGGGIFADGALLRGKNGFAGEIGHMVVQARGIACPCGGMGCWERYVSGSALRRLAREAAKDGRFSSLAQQKGNAHTIEPEDVMNAAREGHDDAIDLVKQISWWLAVGLANLIAILDAGHFIIGGGLSEVSDLYLPYTREYLRDLVEGYESRPNITVSGSAFGPHSGAMGAALVAFERSS
jgi:glucokinase